MFKKLTAVTLSLALAAASLVGCSNVKGTNAGAGTTAAASDQPGGGQTASTGQKYKIAFIVKSLQSAFFINMTEAAEKCGQDYADKISVEIMAPRLRSILRNRSSWWSSASPTRWTPL